jgi:hypothetical protein
MPPKAEARTEPPTAVPERPVANPAVEFGVDRAAVRAYAAAQRVELVGNSVYLDPQKQRYVVVSVDTSAGGAHSDEAFAVFLVAAGRYGLLTARTVVGHDPRYAFSTLPLIYVLALLETLRAVRRLLRRAHAASAFAAQPFRFPRVLVVLESNFAYGAAVYIQILNLLEQKQARHRDIRALDIVFATPVYTWDQRMVLLRMRLAKAEENARRAAAARDTLADAVVSAWEAKGRKEWHLNRGNVIASVWKGLNERGVVGDPDSDVWTRTSVEAEVAAVMNGVLERVIPNYTDRQRAEFVTLWATEFKDVLARQLLARHEAAEAARFLARLRIMVDKRVYDGDDDLVQAPPWPLVHDRPVAGADGPVLFPAVQWYNAPKSVFGQWTIMAHKVRAYRQWVSIVKGNSHRPMQVLDGGGGGRAAWAAELRAAFDGPEGPDDRPDDLARPSGPLGDRGLPSAAATLRAVYEQWRGLAVYVSADAHRTIRRVEGKQRSSTTAAPPAGPAGRLLRDDLWMAVSIGMAWCAQFTQLIPHDDQRDFLVRYMLDLRKTVHASLGKLLRDTDPSTAPAPENEGGEREEEERAAAVEVSAAGAAHRHRPLPPPPPPPAETDAVVVVGAVFHAALTIGADLRRLIRHIVLACVAGGDWEVRGGFRLVVTRSERRLAGDGCDGHHYRETVLSQLRREGRTTPEETDRIVAPHARWCHTLRWLCGDGPGPRYAWPGPTAASVVTHGRGNQRAPVAEQLRALGDRVVRLAAVTPAIRAAHGADHPLIGHADTADILGRLWVRLAGIETEARTVFDGLPDAVRRRADASPLSALNRACAERAAPPGAAPPGAVPDSLLVGYAGVSADIHFLRRAEEMHRTRILPVLRARMPKRWDSPATPAGTAAPGPPGIPAVSCRLTTRRVVGWKQMYAALWPESFRAEERARAAAPAGAAAAAGTVVYASRIELCAD